MPPVTSSFPVLVLVCHARSFRCLDPFYFLIILTLWGKRLMKFQEQVFNLLFILLYRPIFKPNLRPPIKRTQQKSYCYIKSLPSQYTLLSILNSSHSKYLLKLIDMNKRHTHPTGHHI